MQTRQLLWTVSVLPALIAGGPTARADLTPEQQRGILALENLLEINPAAGSLMYQLAGLYVAAGRTSDAKSLLKQAVATGIGLDLAQRPAFAPLRDDTEFQAIRKLAAPALTPVLASALAHRLAEPDLGPEGIAYDPVGKSFYLGSINRHKIVRVTSDGRVIDFTEPGQDGLMGVLGMRVDAARRRLWANANAPAEKATGEGDSAVFAFDLETGKLIRRYSTKKDGLKHLFNDLVVTPAGDVYVTDSESGFIYRIDHESGSLEAFCGGGGAFLFMNGITLTPDGRRLVVSDFRYGLSTVDLASKRITPLVHDLGISTLGVDGLYAHGSSLVAIQNGDGMARIVRYKVNHAFDKITAMKVLERGNGEYQLPTTGVLVGGRLYFVASGVPPEAGRPETAKSSDGQVTVIRSLKL